ncbi:MAG TPA: hypothetical protein VGY77_03525, partial [Gemmataceae bacterium]|nr:hypothetical protein [Gemmataceae bacterium]
MNSSENPKTPLAQADPTKQQTTAVTRMPPADRKFPCAKCGARLDFDPSSHALQCPFCGFTEAIEPASNHVRERNWDEFWANTAGQETVLEGRKCQVTCSVCGAVVLLEDKVAADKCPYCGIFL